MESSNQSRRHTGRARQAVTAVQLAHLEAVLQRQRQDADG
jgi:hypothetical protein